MKQQQSEGGIAEPPGREVPTHDSYTKNHPADTTNEVLESPTATPVCIVSEDALEEIMDNAAEIPMDDLAKDTANLFTCMSDLFKHTCVEEIQCQITIRDDLMNQEVTQVKELIAEFADVFALSVSEVKQVEGAVH